MPPTNAAVEQKCVFASNASAFAHVVNDLIKQGWAVVPGTVAGASRGVDAEFVAVVQRPRTLSNMESLTAALSSAAK